MANPEHLAILKQGVEQWNKWRDEHPDVVPSLSKADLSGADLRKANLGLADLGGANLLNADLRGAEFLVANLHVANLTGADFGEAWAWGTQFDDVDLSVAKSLETVKHFGPSSIGIDTIYKSHGKIPEAFLRGCGVPDDVIAYIGSMIGRPIEYHSCFISHLSEDQEFAERLHADLQGKGVRCWFAPQDMHGGRTINEQIDEAIRKYDRLLLILSEESMKSDWVRTEIAKARRREKEDKRVLFPVRLVSYETMQSWEYIDSSGKDLAEEIRQYFIPDFSKWKEHDSYQAALGRLVGDLKASG
jgi:TIR domain/Pentapeptide repeats (8 copies)